MRIRKLVSAGAAAAMVVGGVSLAVAPAASAAVSAFEVELTESDPLFGSWGGGDPDYYYQTCTMSISESGDYDYYDVGYEDFDGNPPYTDMEFGVYTLGGFDPTAPGTNLIDDFDDEGTFEFDAGDYTVVVTTNDSGDTGLANWTLTGGGTATLSGGCGYGGGSAASGIPIPEWVQAYGRFGANATCEDGWKPSWQHWAEPITGGWVCTRSIPSLG